MATQQKVIYQCDPVSIKMSIYKMSETSKQNNYKICMELQQEWSILIVNLIRLVIP